MCAIIPDVMMIEMFIHHDDATRDTQHCKIKILIN